MIRFSEIHAALAAAACRICVPKSSRGRISSPHASHSTVNADVKRALQDGHRQRISPSHCGQAAGSSASHSSK